MQTEPQRRNVTRPDFKNPLTELSRLAERYRGVWSRKAGNGGEEKQKEEKLRLPCRRLIPNDDGSDDCDCLVPTWRTNPSDF